MRTLAIACVMLAGCAPGTRMTRTEEPVDLRPRLEPGAIYEILHRETRALDGAEPRVVRTRTFVEVAAELPDGTRRLRGHIVRSLRDTGEDAQLVSAVVRFDVSPEGRVVGDPQVECGSAEGDLRIGRFLRYVFGARAIARDDVREGSRWSSELLSDAIELSSPARYRIDALAGGHARGRLAASVHMESGDIGPLRVTGTGRVRGRFSVDVGDGFTGRTDLSTVIRGDVDDTSASRRIRGTVRTTSTILVRRVSREDALVAECGVFDSSIVTAAIRRRLREIQTCYEAHLLRRDPRAAGRILVRFTIGVDARIRSVQVTEDTMGAPPEMLGCMTAVLRSIRLHHAPVGGSVTYSYPFHFAPLN